MKILVIGSGAREHALVWKIAQSPLVGAIYCAPGNAGIEDSAQLVPIAADDISGLLQFASNERIDLTVVGPELPLTRGIADAFQDAGLKIFGPGKGGSRLEASKVFTKRILRQYGIPTAEFETCDRYEDLERRLGQCRYPVVLKADGLAAGKGVFVASGQAEAAAFARRAMKERVFGDSGSVLLLEDCLEGREISVLAMVAAQDFLLLPEARDHKRVLDQDEGPNTGGMGAFSPVPGLPPKLIESLKEIIFERIIAALGTEGIEYRGVLYAGLMLTQEGPKVLEFNVRFGDPETQAILPRLNCDLVELMIAASNGSLRGVNVDVAVETAISVVAASGGYPGPYQNGFVVEGLESARKIEGVTVFHAGTTRREGRVVTNGGRVLSVTAVGAGMAQARERAYEAIGKIHFDRMHYRKDIGREYHS